LQGTLKLEENKYMHIDPAMEELREYLQNLKFQLNLNMGKKMREDVWCTFCMTKGHHKNECLTFVQYIGIGIPNKL
jgi:hypothetical protein